MEKKQFTKETLLQALDTMNEQADKFILWYINTLIYRGSIFRFSYSESVFLPYWGKDENVILKLFETFVKIKYPSSEMVTNHKELILKLIRVATGKAEKPGVILQGNVGTGKTTLILIWLEFRLTVLCPAPVDRCRFDEFNANLNPTIIRYSPIEFRTHFFQDEYAFIENGAGKARKNKSIGEIMVIDDLGLGSIISHFGSDINVLEELIYRRYEEFKRASNFEFYGTTNIRRTDMEKNFNPRFYSRVNEMASWEPMVGEDKRKEPNLIKQWPNLPEIKYNPVRPSRW